MWQKPGHFQEPAFGLITFNPELQHILPSPKEIVPGVHAESADTNDLTGHTATEDNYL